MVKYYLWLSAITSKVTGFTIIKAIIVLPSLTSVLTSLTLLSTIIDFISSFALRDLTLAFVASRALCSLRFVLSHESLLNWLFSEKTIFFELNMTSNIIKSLDVVVMGKVNMHVFLTTWQRTDHNLDLLFISHFMPSSHQFINHVRHDRKMLPYCMIWALLVAIKFEG